MVLDKGNEMVKSIRKKKGSSGSCGEDGKRGREMNGEDVAMNPLKQNQILRKRNGIE